MRGVCLLAATVVVSLSLTACAPGSNTVYVTMETYISAVSLNDVSRILATTAPYQRELMSATTPEQEAALGKKYRDQIEGGYMLWEHAKSARELSPDPLGIALIRAIGLGREGGAAVPEAGDHVLVAVIVEVRDGDSEETRAGMEHERVQKSAARRAAEHGDGTIRAQPQIGRHHIVGAVVVHEGEAGVLNRALGEFRVVRFAFSPATGVMH